MDVTQADRVIEILEKELRGIKRIMKTLTDMMVPQKIDALVESLNNLSKILTNTSSLSSTDTPLTKEGDEEKTNIQTDSEEA